MIKELFPLGNSHKSVIFTSKIRHSSLHLVTIFKFAIDKMNTTEMKISKNGLCIFLTFGWNNFIATGFYITTSADTFPFINWNYQQVVVFRFRIYIGWKQLNECLNHYYLSWIPLGFVCFYDSSQVLLFFSLQLSVVFHAIHICPATKFQHSDW
jgi:hypothetical protein